MPRHGVPVLLVLTLACGSNRQLQSITVEATANAVEVQFTASGTFSAPPTKVVPLPVEWFPGFLAPPPGNVDYKLTTEPYVLSCLSMRPGIEIQVTALAPQNPGAPVSGSLPWAKLVVAHSAIACP
jgi:hypothetical protein